MNNASPPPALSGAQWTIEAAGQRAVVVEVGGGLREYQRGGVDVIDGYGTDELCPGGAGSIMAPWPNRIRDGRYTFGGQPYQLVITEPDRHNAIHGLTRWARWQLVNRAPGSVTVEHALVPQAGYPWPVLLRTTWTLGADGLTAAHTATNVGNRECPFGLAAHPYLHVPGVPVDELLLRVPARTRLLVDGRGLPIGAARVAGGEFDFTTARRIGGAVLDTAFGDLDPGDAPAGSAPGGGPAAGDRSVVELSTVDGRGVQIWADEAFGWWQVFTGDTLPLPRRRRSVAIEPMTCPPDAFRSGRGVVSLPPGATWHGAWGLSPTVGHGG